jgi:tellurite methyltransferase
LKYFPDNAKILDLGCGDGRNSIFLAEYNLNFQITAIDKSKASIKRFERRIQHFKIKNITAYVGDIQTINFDGTFDVILVQGILHFLDKKNYDEVFKKIFALTSVNGFNLVSDFTNLIPFPEDIKEIFVSHLENKELFEIYKSSNWDIILYEHYQAADTHMADTVFHRHDITHIFTRKLS